MDQEPVKIEIDGTLDLHHFNPKEISDLINDYLDECLKKEILTVRLIHGKGKGILKNRVHTILKKHNNVKTYTQADVGNWGATIVILEKTN